MAMLDGKVAIITGASLGIGQATAALFAREGAALVLNARGAPALEATADALRLQGARVRTVAGDAGQAQTHARLVAEAEASFGGLDIAFNNAGTVGAMKPLAEIEPGEWQTTLAGNLTAAYLGARSQIPAMLARGGGAIIFTSSFVGTSVGLPGMAAYGAAKAGLMGLVKGIAAD
ncbi:short-chain dehydrogenase, partial [Salmonella enterica subsp. enterica serovar Virchow]|nr:short-chain dehydrogenase [Salmonella enterica subsp. enterica serovar Virchow]